MIDSSLDLVFNDFTEINKDTDLYKRFKTMYSPK